MHIKTKHAADEKWQYCKIMGTHVILVTISILEEQKGLVGGVQSRKQNYIAGSLPRSLVIPRAIQIRSRTKVWSMTQSYNYVNLITYFLS